MKFYVNGEEAGVEDAVVGLMDNDHEVSIGSRQQLNTGGPYNWGIDGLIDEVAIYDRALSGADVQAHFDAAFVPIPEPSTLMLTLVGLISLAGFARRRRVTAVELRR